LLVCAILGGFGEFLKVPPVMAAVSVGGGIILLVMGRDMIKSASSMSIVMDKEDVGHGREDRVSVWQDNPVIAGVLCSLSNPYWIIWWVTIGLGYLVAAGKYGFYGLCAFFLGHIAADYAWYVAVATGISRGRSIMSDTVYQNMIRCCGLFLLGFGLWFLKEAFTATGIMA
jgi:threonine/homoserine/homoserine lactone efflux protein